MFNKDTYLWLYENWNTAIWILTGVLSLVYLSISFLFVRKMYFRDGKKHFIMCMIPLVRVFESMSFSRKVRKAAEKAKAEEEMSSEYDLW